VRPPPPEVALIDRTPHNRSDERAARNGKCVSSHSYGAVFRRPEVSHHAAGVCHRRGSEQPCEEPRDHNGLYILCCCSPEDEAGGDHTRRKYGDLAPVQLRYWSPNERPEAEAISSSVGLCELRGQGSMLNAVLTLSETKSIPRSRPHWKYETCCSLMEQ